MKRSGFTLSELLVALAILGVIATFTIPKILESTTNSQRNAILKENFATMSAVVYQSHIEGDLSQSTIYSVLADHLNVAIACTDASAQGCWPGSTDAGGNTATEGGFLLHNGSMITDIDANGTYGETFWIDWNGTDGPNLTCEDQIPFVIAYGTGTHLGAPVIRGRLYSSTNPPFTGSTSTCAENVYTALWTN